MSDIIRILSDMANGDLSMSTPHPFDETIITGPGVATAIANERYHLPMKASKRCPKCASADILERLEVFDPHSGHMAGSSLAVATYQKPQAVFFTGRQTNDIFAWLCAKCGFVELYASEPEKVRISNSSVRREQPPR